MSNSSLQESSDKDIYWRVVSQKRGGKLYIHQLKLGLDDTGSVVMEKLYKEYQQLKSRPPYDFWDRFLIFWNPVIETAILSTYSISDLEAQQNMRQVFVTQRNYDVELTAAFYDPRILSNAEHFVRDNRRFEKELGEQALLIGLKMNWVGFLALLLVNLVLCLGAGMVVGLLTRRVDLGVAMTSGVAAVVAYIQAFISLMYR